MMGRDRPSGLLLAPAAAIVPVAPACGGNGGGGSTDPPSGASARAVRRGCGRQWPVVRRAETIREAAPWR